MSAKRIKVLYLEMARYGVYLENMGDVFKEIESSNYPINFFISVPKKSHLTLEDGTPAIGEDLAKFFKQKLFETLAGDLQVIRPNDLLNFVKVLFKVREEEWTLEKEQISTGTAFVTAVRLFQNKE